MSHHESSFILYTRECNEIVNTCQKRLKNISEVINEISLRSQSLFDEDTQLLFESVKSNLDNSLKECLNISSWNKGDRESVERSRELNSIANRAYLTAESVAEHLSATFKKKMMEATPEFYKREGFDQYLESIANTQVRTAIRLLSRDREHAGLNNDELRDMAENILDPSKVRTGSSIEKIENSMRCEMESKLVDRENIDKVFSSSIPRSPLDIMNSADTEIIDESMRRQAIQAISKEISARGFIVDRKNIRINREDNTVNMSASKPGGQHALFSISLNGRFEYRFDGYEGMACMEDITVLTDTLEKVYGIKLENRNEIWRNPDKITNIHHEEMKVRRE